MSIKLTMTRRLRSGLTDSDCTYADKPASIETWIDHCPALAEEFGITVLDVHERLFKVLPEIFGP